jgi:hypothetical protein
MVSFKGSKRAIRLNSTPLMIMPSYQSHVLFCRNAEGRCTATMNVVVVVVVVVVKLAVLAARLQSNTYCTVL